MIEDEIYNHFSELVGNEIYPQIAPDNIEPPYLVYTIITAKPKKNPSGEFAYVKSRIQIDVYGKTSIEAKILRGRVITSIKNFPFYSSDLNWRDGYESQVKFYRQIIEFYTKEGECNGN